MAKSTKAVKAVTFSFTTTARRVAGFQKEYDAKSVLATVAFKERMAALAVKRDNGTALVMQQFIDTWLASGAPKDKTTCNALGKAITQNEVVQKLQAEGAMNQSTWTNYAQSAKRAFFFGIPFTCGLFKDEERVLPWSTQNANATKPEDKTVAAQTAGKSGAVEVTTRDALVETLRKAIKQAQLLNLTSLHDELLELADDNGFGLEFSTAPF